MEAQEAYEAHRDCRGRSLGGAKKPGQRSTRKDPATRGAAIRALAEIGPGVPAVRSFFLKLLGSSRWEDRVYAMDAAAAAEDRSVLKKVVANLDRKRWQVRHAAAQALGSIRVREAVLPMILRLEVEDVQRIRAHPLVPGSIPIYGYIYDVKTGRLEEVPEALAAGRAL